jgi:hypothetical protein
MIGKLTEEELERVLLDGSMKRDTKADYQARGEKWDEGYWRYCLQLFGYSYCEPDPPDDPNDRAEWETAIEQGWIVIDPKDVAALRASHD